MLALNDTRCDPGSRAAGSRDMVQTSKLSRTLTIQKWLTRADGYSMEPNITDGTDTGLTGKGAKFEQDTVYSDLTRTSC